MVDSAKPKAEPWYPFGSGPPVVKQAVEQAASAPAASLTTAKPTVDFPAGSASMLSTAQANALPPFGPDAPSFINDFLRGNSEPAFGRQVSIAAGDKTGASDPSLGSTVKSDAAKAPHVHVHPPVPARSAFGELLHAEAKEINRANGVVNSAVTQGLAVDAIKAVVESKLQGHAKDVALNLVAGAEDLPAISTKLVQSQKIAGAIQSAAAKADGPEQATALVSAKLRGDDGAVAAAIIASVAVLQQSKQVAEVSAPTSSSAVSQALQGAAVASVASVASELSSAMPATLGGLPAGSVERGIMAGVAAAASQEMGGPERPAEQPVFRSAAVDVALASEAASAVAGAGPSPQSVGIAVAAGATAGAVGALATEATRTLAPESSPSPALGSAVAGAAAGAAPPGAAGLAVSGISADPVNGVVGAAAGAAGAVACTTAGVSLGQVGSEGSPTNATSELAAAVEQVQASSALAGLAAGAAAAMAGASGALAAPQSIEDVLASGAVAGAALGVVAAESVSRIPLELPGVVVPAVAMATAQDLPGTVAPSFSGTLPAVALAIPVSGSAISNLVGADALAAAHRVHEASVKNKQAPTTSDTPAVVAEKPSSPAAELEVAAPRALAPAEERSTAAPAEKRPAPVEDRSTFASREHMSAGAALMGHKIDAPSPERYSDGGAKGLLEAASSVVAAVSSKASDFAQHGVSKAEAAIAGAAGAFSDMATSQPKPESRVSLEQALAAHMREKGFDNQSIGAAGAIATAIGRDSHGADLGDAVLILHKEGQKGDPLATVVSAKDVHEIRQPGDSVLALDTLEKIASKGLDTTAVKDLRGHAPEAVRGQSDLEISQSTGQAKSAIKGLEQLQAPEQQAPKQEKVAAAEQRDAAMSM